MRVGGVSIERGENRSNNLLGLLMKDIETAGWPRKRELANGFETQVHNEEQRYRKQNT